jgi:peptidoglycan/xylan/chitin deacetylase (PgdA/CDA1 family)
MSLRTILLPVIFILCIAGFTGCAKDVPRGEMSQGMIALSFDDTYIDNWYSYLPLLDSLEIKATFYVSAYHILTNQQKNKLRAIEAHGNEIGYHTTTHANLLKLCRSSGIDAIINREITPDLALMRNDGFNPVSFAYPFGQHDTFMDRQLLHYFKSVRAISKPNYYSCYMKHTGTRQILYGMGIDSREKTTNEKLEYQIRLAWENNDCILLFTHAIDQPWNNYQVNSDRLRFIAKIAAKYDMKFVRTSDITQ